MKFWDKAIPILFELLVATGYDWGSVVYHEDPLYKVKTFLHETDEYPQKAWESGTLDNRFHTEKRKLCMFNPSYSFADCILLDEVELGMLPYKPPILSQILVPGQIAEKMLDFLIKRVGFAFDLCMMDPVEPAPASDLGGMDPVEPAPALDLGVMDLVEPVPAFDVFLIEVEFDADGSIMYADSSLDDADERINLFRI